MIRHRGGCLKRNLSSKEGKKAYLGGEKKRFIKTRKGTENFFNFGRGGERMPIEFYHFRKTT